MKTPEEIKKGLIWCIKGDFCKGCPYEDDCYVNLNNIPMVKEALAYIQQLESELEAVKRERDAAVYDLGEDKLCGSCKYRDNENKCNGTNCYTCELDCPCAKHPCGYEWRGVCLENTEVQDENA